MLKIFVSDSSSIEHQRMNKNHRASCFLLGWRIKVRYFFLFWFVTRVYFTLLNHFQTPKSRTHFGAILLDYGRIQFLFHAFSFFLCCFGFLLLLHPIIQSDWRERCHFFLSTIVWTVWSWFIFLSERPSKFPRKFRKDRFFDASYSGNPSNLEFRFVLNEKNVRHEIERVASGNNKILCKSSVEIR